MTGRWMVQELGSVHGTTCNGKPVSKVHFTCTKIPEAAHDIASNPASNFSLKSSGQEVSATAELVKHLLITFWHHLIKR